MIGNKLIINTHGEISSKNQTNNIFSILNYYKDVVDKKVTGWFYPLDIIAFYSIIKDAQKKLDLTGDICELGVAFGKSAVGLSLMKNDEDFLYLYDYFGAEITPEMAHDAIKQYGKDLNVDMRVCDLMKLSPTEIKFNSQLRFLHIDACHFHSAVLNDLNNFSPFVDPRGIISVDDINDPEYPGINTAVAQFCLSEVGKDWKMFAIGQNKAYLAKTEYVRYYTKFLIEYLRNNMKYENISFSEVMDIDVLLIQSRSPMKRDIIDSYLNDKYFRTYG
jgi:hypothetical protein